MTPPVASKDSPLSGTPTSGDRILGNPKSSQLTSSLHNGEKNRSPSPIRQKYTGSTALNATGVGSGAATNGFAGPSTVRELHGYVGFANIPNQVYRKAIKQGFDFTLMVVGQSGLGKSTFINSLFMADIYPNKPSEKTTETVKVEEQTVRLVENGVNLSLTLVDTPGFGDQVDNSKCWDPIIQFVDKKYSHYFTEETNIQRSDRIPDHRVHCCLYFIPPTGHGLKPLDVEFMKHLHDRVNIIPVIGKADTLTPDELSRFKQRIMSEIKEQGIKVYKFPDPEEGEEEKELLTLKDRVPFAVVGSNIIQDAGSGKKVRCRKYPWGIIEVENLEHNDFVALRNMVIRTHMIDMVDVTRSVHYENFRYRQLMSSRGKHVGPKVDTDKDPFTMIEAEKKEHDEKMKKSQADMERVFQEKVQDKQDTFKKHEAELEKKVAQFQASLDAKRSELEQKQKQLQEFKEQYPQLASYSSTISVGSSGSSDFGKKKKLGLFK